jgi:Primase C terminal 2 (PriCT-2)
VALARALRVAERPPDRDPQASFSAGQLRDREATSSQSVTQALAVVPRREELETFVLALFKYATPGNWVSLRAFLDDRDEVFKITPVKLNGDLDALIDRAYRDAQVAAKARDKIVFAPPIATFTNGRHARQEDLAEGLALSVECDEHARAARAKLKKLLGPATVVVESGGKWRNPETGKDEAKLHIHYRLKIPACGKDELAKLKLARKLATKIVGGDPSNVPMVHPIRWPGSMHRKARARLCRIVAVNPDSEIDLDVALEVLKQAAAYSENDADAFERAGNEQASSKQASIDLVTAALRVIPNDDFHWNDWNYIGMATWLATNGEGFAAFDMWSQKSKKKYNACETRERWQHYFSSPPTQIGAGTLFYLANKYSPEWRQLHESAQWQNILNNYMKRR